MAEKNERFIRTYMQGGAFSTSNVQIWVDKQTGVNYLYTSYSYGGGLTPLLNRDGTPVITPVTGKYPE